MTRGRRARTREGTTAILVMFAMVVIIGMAAHAVDAGHLYKVRAELQNGADASALVGAKQLNGSSDGVDGALTEVATFSETFNSAYSTVLAAQEDDIQVGSWDADSTTFTELDPASVDPADIDAVRVVTRRDEDNGTINVGTPFADFLGPGDPGAAVSADAVAWADIPDACGFPMVVGDCALEDVDEESCEFCFINQNANDDTFGWTGLDDGSANPGNIAALIAAACFSDPATAEEPAIDESTHHCIGDCNGSSMEDDVRINNGNGFLNSNDNVSNPCELIERLLERNGSDAEYFTVTIPVVPSSDCPEVDYQNVHGVEGYAVLDIWGVKCGNSSPAIVDDDHPLAGVGGPCTPPSDKFVLGTLRCDEEAQEPGEIPGITFDVKLVE